MPTPDAQRKEFPIAVVRFERGGEEGGQGREGGRSYPRFRVVFLVLFLLHPELLSQSCYLTRIFKPRVVLSASDADRGPYA